MSTGLFFQHCRALGVETVETEADLKTAYRRQISRWHPDRHQLDPAAHAEALERSKDINAAYEYLSELLEGGYTPPRSPSDTEASQRWRSYTESYRTRRTYRQQTYAAGFPDSSIIEVFVKSSNIVSVGYQSTTSTLYVKFVGDSVYRYFGVPVEVYDALLAAPSHGKYLNAAVIGRFRYERC
jgi:hypothetical protein